MFVDEPGTLSISGKPDIINGKLTVKEGETVGPYNCSADCNPPCEIKWRYKDIGDKVNDVSSSGHELSILKVNRNISLLRCIAIYMNKTDNKKKHNITLDVQCQYNRLLDMLFNNGMAFYNFDE